MTTPDLALHLLAQSPVTSFWRPGILADTVAELAGAEYQIVSIDATAPKTERDFLGAIGAALDFPDYYGHNLDALNDCLRDVVSHDYGWRPDAAGLVIVFTGYQAAVANWPRTAQLTLDIIARHSRVASLFGGRLLCLVQTDDPDAVFERVGSSPVLWNNAEWANSRRRTD